MCIFIHTYIHTHMYVYMHVYIHICVPYIHTHLIIWYIENIHFPLNVAIIGWIGRDYRVLNPRTLYFMRIFFCDKNSRWFAKRSPLLFIAPKFSLLCEVVLLKSGHKYLSAYIPSAVLPCHSHIKGGVSIFAPRLIYGVGLYVYDTWYVRKR